jgi:ABC-type antimicrobial peptide transport system permease subunit
VFFTYLLRELRRRRRQAALVSLGLAVGVGLVVTVGAASSAASSAQDQVLHSLYGVGTDLTVTKAPTAGSGGGFHFGGAAGSAPRSFSGSHIGSSPGLALLSNTDVTKVAALSGVRSAVGGLSLISITFSGQFTPGSGPPSSTTGPPSFSANTVSIVGVDINNPAVGPLSGTTLLSGHYFASSDQDAQVALLDSSYAKQQGLKAGSTVTLGGSSYRVLGVVSPPSGGTGSDVYIPLERAQALGSAANQVNTIYVEAQSSSGVSAVSREVSGLLPSATVTTAATLASQVSSSLGATSGLAGSLGTWLAVIVLIVAFALAAMLSLSSVSARVREFGTLKALGWRTRRVVGQILGEGLAEGVVGATLGVGLGFLGAYLVGRIGGTVKTVVGSSTFPRAGGAFAAAAGRFRPGAALGGGGHTVTVHLNGTVGLATLGLAVGLAVAGGLLAGGIGGWRVARLQPAEALRQVG